MPRNLKDEWQQLKKDWYHVYQWPALGTNAYTEEVAAIILENYDVVELARGDLRQRSFKVANHHGQANSKAEKIGERLFCRALYNLRHVAPLGQVVDYEIPLREYQDSDHGPIDLLCANDATAWIVEAKFCNNRESVLKATLEAYVHSRLIAPVRNTFLDNFGLPATLGLTASVVTFLSAASGIELKNMAESRTCPKTRQLIGKLNDDLKRDTIYPLRFFIVDAGAKFPSQEEQLFCDNFEWDMPSQDERQDKPVFKDGFQFALKELQVVTHSGT